MDKKTRQTRSVTKCMGLVSLLVLMSIAYIQSQDVVIDGKSAATVLPLGIIQFTNAGGDGQTLPEDVGQIVFRDLEFSGRVKLMGIPESPAKNETVRNQLLAEDAFAYVSGEFFILGGDITVKCYLKDTETDEMILGKKYTARKTTPRQLRMAAHQFADELVYQLFGEKGVAQTQITYVSKQAGHKQVYTMDYDGAHVNAVTQNPTIHLSPTWLENNQSVMYTSYGSGKPQLYHHILSTGRAQVFDASDYLNMGPDYNPVDREIVYTSSVKGNTEIFRISETGKDKVRLTYSPALEASPSWSPNGYEIVFTSSRSGNPMLYIMDRDGSNIRRLTYEGKYNTSANWSPRGDKIVLCGMGEGGVMDIYTIDAAGKNLIRLTRNAGQNEGPYFSPDGRAIVFSSTRTGKSEIFTMTEDGKKQTQITFTGGNESPAWSSF